MAGAPAPAFFWVSAFGSSPRGAMATAKAVAFLLGLGLRLKPRSGNCRCESTGRLSWSRPSAGPRPAIVGDNERRLGLGGQQSSSAEPLSPG